MTAASEAQNGGVTFNHTGPALVVSRQMLERFQVRTCTGAAGQRDVTGGKRVRGPVEVELVATGLGIAEAVRMCAAAGRRARYRAGGARARLSTSAR